MSWTLVFIWFFVAISNGVRRKMGLSFSGAIAGKNNRYWGIGLSFVVWEEHFVLSSTMPFSSLFKISSSDIDGWQLQDLPYACARYSHLNYLLHISTLSKRQKLSILMRVVLEWILRSLKYSILDSFHAAQIWLYLLRLVLNDYMPPNFEFENRLKITLKSTKP